METAWNPVQRQTLASWTLLTETGRGASGCEGGGLVGSRRMARTIVAALFGVALVATLIAAAAEAQTKGETCGLPPAATADILYDADQAPARAFAFTYEAEVPPQPAGVGPIDIFIPLATSDAHQTILRRTVRASIPGRERTESRYGNHFWHGHLDQSDGKLLTIAVTYLVSRHVFEGQHLASASGPLSQEDRKELALFLGPDRLVPVSGLMIDKVRAELPKSDPTPLGRARAIYDYVIDHMEYKKVGTGWGNGDTFWACSAHYGNCTDFHALFISLARAEGIPARFEIGFPIPEDRSSGVIEGYHCWVEVHLPGVGWFPIDAAEAWKHKERRDLYFGTYPADRLQVTIGRDLELGEGHTTGPLNYFIYPHVEVAGQQLERVKTLFRFSEIPEGQLAAKEALNERVGP